MSQGWKITVVVLAAAGLVSTPLLWLLNSPDSGQLAGASVQAAVGIAALVWALFQTPGNRPNDAAIHTGVAGASHGGTAVTGVKRSKVRDSRAARADGTGNATAAGEGSTAVSGIDYT